ncbi:recombinase family protein [Tardiphaga sp.]|uniref:recombinase family protein n=1 Tax=Tardiphaga sp. TaxID=1926292 RepID=UPI0026071953|nr:recombinase family protein [Tardiphaga sp.]MDB5620673.1 Resolvase, N-terminal domain [Tardiphaga sp.]
MKIGYARKSTTNQSLDGQVDQLRLAGCSRIVEETASGAASDRPALRKLIQELGPGSALVVIRLDRLARSTIDLLTILKSVADRGASFVSLQESWADTTTAAGRLILTVIGGLAEFERELIKSRTSEGRERAKARGVRMGRKHKLTPHQQAEVRKRKAEGQSVRELGRSYNVSANTISRIK